MELISTDYSISDEEALSWGPVEGTRNHRAPETEEAGGGALFKGMLQYISANIIEQNNRDAVGCT